MNTFVEWMQAFHEVLARPGAWWVRRQLAAARWWGRMADSPVALRWILLLFVVVCWVFVAWAVRWVLR